MKRPRVHGIIAPSRPGGDVLARLDLDMTEGNIWMHMIRFSVPMAIGLLFQQLYNTVDTLVVG